MAVRKIKVRGDGVVQLKSTRTTQDAQTITIVETYHGPYASLQAKQNANIGAKSTHLEPTSGGEGKLTITRETQDSTASTDDNYQVFTEVVWQQLVQPVEKAPAFGELTEQEVLDTKKAVEDRVPPVDALMLKLYKILARGTEEYVIGVPVVRRTTTRRSGNVGGGRTWYRDTPPVTVTGSWDWLKTADERRREGNTYTHIEEWTGAEEWDETLYPVDPET